MYNTLLRLYRAKKIGAAELANAVIMKWITEVQKNEIMKVK